MSRSTPPQLIVESVKKERRFFQSTIGGSGDVLVFGERSQGLSLKAKKENKRDSRTRSQVRVNRRWKDRATSLRVLSRFHWRRACLLSFVWSVLHPKLL